MATIPQLGDYYTQPDWGVVDHFAQLYGIVHESPRDSREFREAQAHLEDNALLFLEHCAWIMVHATRQHVLFKPNEPQLVLWEEFDLARREQRPVLINLLKYRRWGASTEIALFFAFRALIYPNTMTLILPKEKAPGSKVFKMYETFFDFLFHGAFDNTKKARYARFQPRHGSGARTGWKLVFGDPIDGTLGLNCEIELMIPKEASSDGTGSVARGGGAQSIHGTEFAFWANIDAAWAALMPNLPDNPGSACIFETTSSGAGTQYEKFWNDCANGSIPFKNIFLGWTAEKRNALGFDDERAREKFIKDLNQSDEDQFGNECILVEEYGLTPEQLKWRRRTLGLHCKGDLLKFNQEYPLTAEMAFAHSGTNFINQSKIWVFVKGATPPVISGRMEAAGAFGARINENARVPLVRLWEDRQEWSEYLIVADFAKNEEAKDHTAALVLKRLEYRHVGTFRGDDDYRPRLYEACEQIAMLARYYNNAMIVPERNYLGEGFIEHVLNVIGYQNIITEADYLPAHAVHGGDGATRYGVPTHRGNRQAMMEALKYLFEEEDNFELYDELVIRECQALRPVRTGNGMTKIQAPMKGQSRRQGSTERGYYDDLAMCLAIGYWVQNKLPAPQSREDLRQRARRREELRGARREGRGDDRIGVV